MPEDGRNVLDPVWIVRVSVVQGIESLKANLQLMMFVGQIEVFVKSHVKVLNARTIECVSAHVSEIVWQVSAKCRRIQPQAILAKRLFGLEIGDAGIDIRSIV